MDFVIVTGMSGAGKTTALKILEDMGYFCIDNIPPALIKKMAELAYASSSDIMKLALGVDTRVGKLFKDFLPWLESPESDEYKFKLLFLDSNQKALLKRYKESRRKHPMNNSGAEADLRTAIEDEMELLIQIKQKADYVLDTSHILPKQLREQMAKILLTNESFNNIVLRLTTFGFKHGIPNECDLVFDTRFIPNPFYIPELKPLTGNDTQVRDYVLNTPAAQEFVDKLKDMLSFLIPHYIDEGKHELVIGIGCTGGKHRSVSIANYMQEYLESIGYYTLNFHRDVNITR